MGWVHGSLVEPAIEEEPGAGGENVAELLDSAEDIVNQVAPDVLDSVRAEDARRERSGTAGGAASADAERAVSGR